MLVGVVCLFHSFMDSKAHAAMYNGLLVGFVAKCGCCTKQVIYGEVIYNRLLVHFSAVKIFVMHGSG